MPEMTPRLLAEMAEGMAHGARTSFRLEEDKIQDEAKQLQAALKAAYEKGGFRKMMMLAYQVEAGTKMKGITQPKRMLRDVLNALSRELKLKGNESALLHMYRDDLR